MKTKAITLITSLGLAAFASAAVSISGTALKNVQGSASTDLGNGLLGLLIVDTGNDGFLTTNGSGNAAVTSGNPLSGFSYTSVGAGLALNSTFYGDLVIARLTTAVVFGDATMSGTFNASAAAFLDKKYAIVWFETLTTAGSETLASGKFGIASGADWVFPAADSGTFTFGTGAANLDQLTLGAVATAPAGQGVSFATSGTSFSVVPEPSAALLGALGALGLLRRRRN